MKKILATVILLSSIYLSAQTNLVPNSDFQTILKKVKIAGEIEKAEHWKSPTLAKANLFVTKSKNFETSVPENNLGKEKPMKGDNYVGIMAYSAKDKEPRTYLQVKLSEKLKEGTEYCVKIHVSLSDLSKYATSHIGMAISKKAVAANNSEILQFEKPIVSKRLTIAEQQYYWVPICGVFTAKGGEEYLTIGNFTPSAKLKTKKVKRPKGFNKPQKNIAYYYIDNVSVIDAAEAKKCNCDIIPGMENVKTVKRDFDSDKNQSSKGKMTIINTDGSSGVQKESGSAGSGSSSGGVKSIDGMIISFTPKAFELSTKSKEALDGVVAHLKANKKDKIEITGYIDVSEEAVAKLDGRRVGAVYKYLISKGIVKESILRKMGGKSNPLDKKKVTKNMRAEITLIAAE